MSSTRCESYHWMSPIFIISIAIGLLIPSTERVILYFLLVFTTLAHWHYGTRVVNQMCEHFNRICFGVTMREPSTINEKLQPLTDDEKAALEHLSKVD